MTKIFERFRKASIFALILGILWQSSALTSIVNLNHAKAVINPKINEFMPKPTAGNDWVEIYNPGNLDLTGWYLKDAADNKLNLSGTDTYANFDWNVLNNSGDTVNLYDATDALIDTIAYDAGSVFDDKSIARIPDGTLSWNSNQTPTRGATNYTPLSIDAGGDKITKTQITQDATVSGGKTPYTFKWEQVSGPGTVTFGTPTSEDTTMSADVDGSYGIKLTANDSIASGSSTMTLTWDTVAPVLDNIDLNQPNYNLLDFPQPITGTASDATSEISKVEVKIKDTTANPAEFWNGSAWVTETNTWNNATGNTSWSYQFDPANMTAGHDYEVKAKAYDSLDQTSAVATKSFSYIDNIVPNITLTPNTTSITKQDVVITAVVDGTGSSISQIKYAKGDQNVTYFATQGISFTDTFTVTENDTYTVYAKDLSGNETVKTINIANIDKTAPTGTIKIDNGKVLTNTQDVTLDLTYTDTNIDKMRVANDKSKFTADCVEGEWQNVQTPLSWKLTAGDGEKTVYVQYKDKAGNISETYSDTIFLKSNAADITQYNVSNGNTNSFTIGNLLIDVTAKTTVDTTLTTAEYSENPGLSHTFKFFGKYFDLSFENNSQENFPISIDISYTKKDLEDAKIDEKQITGLYFYNSSTSNWELYPSQTINRNNFTEGGIEYEGKITIEADHLTPMVLGADTEAPAIPAQFKAEAKSGSVKLTWNKVDDADHYDIRYRKSTNNNDLVKYSEIYIVTNNETEITNLENGVEYEFNIRAIDKADNKGEWAVVVSTPNYTPEEIAKQAELKKQVAYYGSMATQFDTSQTTLDEKKDEPKDSDEEIITEGEVKSENDVAGETEGARTAVTLGIIIIAIGAALGGYYGYQWWLGEGEVEEEVLPKEKKTPETNKKKNNSNKSNRRW